MDAFNDSYYAIRKRKQIRLIIVVTLSPVLLWLGWYAYARISLQLHLRQLRSEGFALSVDDFIEEAQNQAPADGDPNGKRVMEFLLGLKKEDFKYSKQRQDKIEVLTEYLWVEHELLYRKWDAEVEEEVKLILEDNAQLLNELHKICALPPAHPSTAILNYRHKLKPPSLTPESSTLIGLSSLLELEGILAARQNDPGKVVGSFKSLQQFNLHLEAMPQTYMNITYAIGFRIYFFNLLAEILQIHPMQEEHYAQLAVMAKTLKDPPSIHKNVKLLFIGYENFYDIFLHDKQFDFRNLGIPDSFIAEYRLLFVRPYFLMDMHALLDSIENLSRILESEKDEPWKLLPILKTGEYRKTLLPYPLADMENNHFDSLLERHLHWVTANELVCISLALKRYKLAQDDYPESLDALVPTFLDRVPTDLFDGNPMRYQKLPAGYKIWSVYTNQMDDGGIRRTGDASLIEHNDNDLDMVLVTDEDAMIQAEQTLLFEAP